MRYYVVYPSCVHTGYKIAAESFSDLAFRVSGADSLLLTDKEEIPEDGDPVVVTPCRKNAYSPSLF